MRADLHTHTVYSHDACSSLSSYIRFAQRRRLDVVAVTDHNEIAGAIALQKLAPFHVIVGEEIKTVHGDVIGLFLGELIPAGMSVYETIAAIKAQDGIVYIPHPSWFALEGSNSVAMQMDREELWSLVDGIEVLNGRTLEPQPSLQAQQRAREFDLFCGAGSDAHTPLDLGRAYVELPKFDSPADFLASMKTSSFHGQGGTRARRAVFNRFVRKAARNTVGAPA